jgi:hypothetical protein
MRGSGRSHGKRQVEIVSRYIDEKDCKIVFTVDKSCRQRDFVVQAWPSTHGSPVVWP